MTDLIELFPCSGVVRLVKMGGQAVGNAVFQGGKELIVTALISLLLLLYIIDMKNTKYAL